MQKVFILTLSALLLSFNAGATQIKEGAFYCISAKKIIAYYKYLDAGNADFAQRYIDNADCFTKKRSESVIVHSEQKKYTEVEFLSGFKVWTKNENIIQNNEELENNE